LRAIQTLAFAILLLIVSGFAVGCRKANSRQAPSDSDNTTLTILTTDSIRSSGFLKRIIPAFEQANNCKVEVSSVTDKSELMKTIRDEEELGKIDLVLGLDNCFLIDRKDLELFDSSNALRKHPVNEQFIFDGEQRAIPFGFGYLCILYDEEKIPVPPQSFGELQDARFMNQLVISDPHSSGVGRATLLWTVALFGNSGFQQLWKSIKKNIHSTKDTYSQALNTLESGACGMAIGFTGTPAWNKEKNADALPLRTSLLQEGSFLYIEAAAITKKANSKGLAENFMAYLLSPEVQKYVAFDLGFFPANESAPLPDEFVASPYSADYVNGRLRYEEPEANLSLWLELWDKIFSRSIM
jgi:thiamine transport system substrate-binding protein